jgi:predicted short-subunit dehydrogenase-like oxidoreductase (DUF2520 family)
MSRSFTLIGRGRAGGSLAAALDDLGWVLTREYGRDDDPASAADNVDLCVIATPDDAIARVASQIEPGSAVVMHLSGATGLGALHPHRAAAMHPLVSLPNPHLGVVALRSAWFGVGGDPLARELADELSGRVFPLDDADRTVYHAAAAVASNHLVALMGHVERIAEHVGVPLEAFLHLSGGSLQSVSELGAAAALTGPAARGDDATIAAHLQALAERCPDELATYKQLLAEARRLADID